MRSVLLRENKSPRRQSRRQNQEIILRGNREDSENMALQFTRTMDNSKKLKVRIFHMKNDRAGNNFNDETKGVVRP